jgi:ATP-dependent Clp protease ATP-binding subunit ClpA
MKESTPTVCEKVLALAAEEARRYRQSYVGTEHFLLALVRFAQDDSLFQAFELNEARIRHEMELFIIAPAAPAIDAGEHLPVIESLKDSIDRTRNILRKKAKKYADVDDLLAGLATGESLGGSILAGFGVTEKSLWQAQEQLKNGVSPDHIRRQNRPKDPLEFAEPFARDPFVAEKIRAIRNREKKKWAMVDSGRFEEAAHIRDALDKEFKTLREYCSGKK